MAIFAERGLAWREKDAYKAYGYNRVLTSDSIAKHVDIDNIGADAALMEYHPIADRLAQTAVFHTTAHGIHALSFQHHQCHYRTKHDGYYRSAGHRSRLPELRTLP